MVPYYLLIGIPIVISLCVYQNKNYKNKIPLLVFFIIFIVLLSLRSMECGIDLWSYKIKFDNTYMVSIKTLFDLDLIEPGYTFFVSINKLLCNNFQFLLFTSATLSIVPIMLLYMKESEHAMLTIALFVGIAPFTMFFSGLRQSIAMGLGIICYHYCKKNKIIPFILIVFLAFLFHQSAVILLLMYPMTHVKITKKWILPILALCTVCLIYNEQVFGVLLRLNEKYEDRYVISETGSYTFLFLLLLLTVFSFVVMKEDSEELLGLRNLLILSLFIQCFAPINTVAMRLNYYFLLFIPISIPKMIQNCKDQYRQLVQILLKVFVVFFIFWFFKEAYNGSNHLHTFPYIPFWEK